MSHSTLPIHANFQKYIFDEYFYGFHDQMFEYDEKTISGWNTATEIYIYKSDPVKICFTCAM